jgi:hypothetical protein
MVQTTSTTTQSSVVTHLQFVGVPSVIEPGRTIAISVQLLNAQGQVVDCNTQVTLSLFGGGAQMEGNMQVNASHGTATFVVRFVGQVANSYKLGANAAGVTAWSSFFTLGYPPPHRVQA